MDSLHLSLPPTPKFSDSEVKQLIQQAQNGEEEARTTLIQANLRLVMSVVRRFENRGFETEDLFQVGTIGLVKSIDGFNLNYDVRFSTYAVPKIIGEIKRYIRESSPIHISRSLKELASRAITVKEQLANELGRNPTIMELATELQVSKEDLVSAFEAVAPVQSIHQVVQENDGDPLLLEDQLAAAEEESSVYLRDVLYKLPPDERRLVLLRYFAEKSQTEVAVALGISQAQVSRIEKRILQEMRKQM